jgi:hypothetical protein
VFKMTGVPTSGPSSNVNVTYPAEQSLLSVVVGAGAGCVVVGAGAGCVVVGAGAGCVVVGAGTGCVVVGAGVGCVVVGAGAGSVVVSVASAGPAHMIGVTSITTAATSAARHTSADLVWWAGLISLLLQPLRELLGCEDLRSFLGSD